MKILILRPVKNKKEKQKTPGILWIHGGGYAVGMASMVYMSRALNLVKKYGAVVISPEYTLAGKAPYPAALEDCYYALLYMKDHADELEINSSQLMVGGESAGGGLTAAVCLLAREREDVKIAYQMPLYPMINDRDTESSRDNHGITWNTKKNHKAWKLYLRDLRGDNIPSCAAPSRETDYSKLPPAYTFIGDVDAFYCETLEYIENLKKAGVEASVDIYPKGFHSFDMLAPWKKISKAAIAKFEEKFEYALENYFAEQMDAVSPNTLEKDIQLASEWVVKALNVSGYNADYSLESMKEIDRFFDEQNKPGGILTKNRGQIIFALGAYVGQSAIKLHGGEWITNDNDPNGEINISVRLSSGEIIFPVIRCMKRCEYGETESIYAYLFVLNHENADNKTQ